jgi:hypothetical protein
MDHAYVNCQALFCFPGWNKDVRVSFQATCCRLFPAVEDGTGLQTPGQEILNAKVSLTELVPFAANHVVPKGVQCVKLRDLRTPGQNFHVKKKPSFPPKKPFKLTFRTS